MLLKHLVAFEFFLGLFIPMLLSMLIYKVIKGLWEKNLDERKSADKNFNEIEYKAETFRNPINLSVTVTGFVIPLICGLIAYLLTTESAEQTKKLSLLFASFSIFLFTMFLGLYLSYSLASVSPNNDSFKISKKENLAFPALFTAQLTLLFMGMVLLFSFLIFRFELKNTSEYKTTDFRKDAEVVEVLRQRIKIGTNEKTVIKHWGRPDSVKKFKEKGEIQFIYCSPTSSYTITFRDSIVVSILEHIVN